MPKLLKPKELKLKNAVPTIDELDKLCREVVRLRDKYTCRRCGRSKEQGWKVEWVHFISRSNKAVRWDLLNSMMGCFECHYKFMHGHGKAQTNGETPESFWTALIGEKNMAILRMRATGKVGDKRLIKLYLEQEMSKLK